MAKRDPVAEHFRHPLYYRLSFWAVVVLIAASAAGIALGAVANTRTSDESKRRTQQLQDVICGVYVPIGNEPVTSRTSQLGRTIVLATRHGALEIHCPGIK
jgi:hypothetical protein